MADLRVLAASLLLVGSQMAAAEQAAPAPGAAPSGPPAAGYGGYAPDPTALIHTIADPMALVSMVVDPMAVVSMAVVPTVLLLMLAARSAAVRLMAVRLAETVTTAATEAVARSVVSHSCRASTCPGATASTRCILASGVQVLRSGWTRPTRKMVYHRPGMT